MNTIIAEKSASLKGEIEPPGDKSISHRALILGALACGTTRIKGLLDSEDVRSTAEALTQLGGNPSLIEKQKDGSYHVNGIGLSAFVEPSNPLDLGNSGTGARLLMGAVAGSGITAIFTGDSSLSARPMKRILEPLTRMGAQVTARQDDTMPLTIIGTPTPHAITYESPHASAQVKSAILLAGLTARGETTIIEPSLSRDHTETMLKHFGVQISSETLPDGKASISLIGEANLNATDIIVPADPSSAGFLAVAALITEGSSITLKGVGINPLRFGLFETLIEMGADIKILNSRKQGGEMVADLKITSSPLKGVNIPPSRAPSMIDEYPILSVAAAFAEGKTLMQGVGELRIKETDRIALMEEVLARAGAKISSTADSMAIEGSSNLKGGIGVDACHDHRIAMSSLVLGLATDEPMRVDGAETIATSFPNFAALMQSAGAQIREAS